MAADSKSPETKTPYEKMRDLAAKVVTASKDEVDRREQEWKDARKDAPPAKK